jgi:hypothetical protein
VRLCIWRSSPFDTSWPLRIVPAVHDFASPLSIVCCGRGCRNAASDGSRLASSRLSPVLARHEVPRASRAIAARGHRKTAHRARERAPFELRKREKNVVVRQNGMAAAAELRHRPVHNLLRRLADLALSDPELVHGLRLLFIYATRGFSKRVARRIALATLE